MIRKKPLFYLFVLALSVLLALYTRLTMAPSPEEFYLFPDAPLWLFLEALLVVFLLDRLHVRATRQNQASGRANYYFGLLWRGALLFVGGLQLLSAVLMLVGVGQGNFGSWYSAVRSLSSDAFLYLLIGSIYLPFLYQQHAGQVRLELERLAKEATRAKLQALQQHVDPHFLFNNLNILAALIEPGNNDAHAYVKHLAEVYRYLVRTRDQEVVPVAEELAFARDYCQLLRYRFGVAYQFEEDVQATGEQLRTQLVPPGVLQELLTNAVKHNLASRTQSLRICIRVLATEMAVCNEQRPRPQPAVGAGSGLAGLQARLALVAATPVRILATDTTFTVTLPLVAALPMFAHAHPAD
ncbi:histidine kinase [Hymenobacter taeanensis]|uniref:Histidine kinase n=1 Tax=Hymenobacter taeanensis TaxID=2735321 RepID=A0A6M6BHH7_9BACT|nr:MULTISPECIES: histidine kinase [Hymenobacter]QJX47637.1 histidine kinase [Hymenobacter taeanensis]UOQ82880.1 histidine kinase [Hymenobacter sp. 5414T-23]